MTKKSLFIFFFCAIFILGIKTTQAQDSIQKTTQDTIVEKLNMALKQPPYLKVGDTVAIVAPSGILKNRNAQIEAAKRLLASWGLEVVVGDHVFSQSYHFAGTDDERYIDFQQALNDPTISAIWCARGGYGTVRILDKLDYSIFKQHPKWIIGYSDITALHNQIHNEGFESIHALMCTSLVDGLDINAKAITTFKDAIFGKPVRYTLKSSPYNVEGSVSGQLVGGNLTLLHTMLGSKTSIDTSGKILFIEEIGEYKYHIDRMLQSLKRAGYFDNCKGLVVGNMTKLRKNTTPWGKSVEQLILDVLSAYDFPIVFNMPAGHELDNRALILGRNIRLSINSVTSTIIF